MLLSALQPYYCILALLVLLPFRIGVDVADTIADLLLLTPFQSDLLMALQPMIFPVKLNMQLQLTNDLSKKV